VASLQRDEYSTEHVRTLLVEYQAWKSKVGTDARGLHFLVQMADLDRVLARLPDNYWEIVLLHGLLDIEQRDVAVLKNVGQATVSRRFTNALDEIVHQLNHRSPS